MKCYVDLTVDELASLLLGCLCHGRMAMAEIGDANAAGEIEHLAASNHGDIASRAALDDLSCKSTDASGYVRDAELSKLGETHDWASYWGELWAVELSRGGFGGIKSKVYPLVMSECGRAGRASCANAQASGF